MSEWKRTYCGHRESNEIEPQRTYKAACLLAGCATPASPAGHTGATANIKLAFHPGHSVGPINLAHAYKAAFRRVAVAMSKGEGVLQ